MKITLIRDYPRVNWQSIEIYADNLHRCLDELSSPEIFVHDYRAFPQLAFSLREQQDSILVRVYRQLLNPLGAYFHQSDITHIVCQSNWRMLYFLKPESTVITVHDLLSYWYKKHYHTAETLEDLQALKRAKHIITVSNTIKLDLIKILGIRPEVIATIPNMIPSSFRRAKPQQILATRKKFHLPSRYILNVGTTVPHKNMAFLLKVFSGIIKKQPDLFLVKLGGKFDKEQEQFIRHLGIQNRIVTVDFVDYEVDLPAIYSGALLYIQTSLVEGFCLPILEAMQCGTPVIISDIPVFRELFSSAEFLNLRDLSGTVKKINRLLIDIPHDLSYSKKCLTNARRYEQKKIARKLVKYYQHISVSNVSTFS